MREICASGCVGGEGGNILAYPAVEPLSLETGKSADDTLELVADLIQMVQPLFETEIVEVVGAEFIAE
jgi:hypothetical protein